MGTPNLSQQFVHNLDDACHSIIRLLLNRVGWLELNSCLVRCVLCELTEIEFVDSPIRSYWCRKLIFFSSYNIFNTHKALFAKMLPAASQVDSKFEIFKADISKKGFAIVLKLILRYLSRTKFVYWMLINSPLLLF